MAKKTKTKSKTSKHRRPVPSDEQRPVPSDEQRVNLMLWSKNGLQWPYPGIGKALPAVSVGRTNSKRGLGFEVTMQPLADPGAEPIAFVLDRFQVKMLGAYIKRQTRRLIKGPEDDDLRPRYALTF
jgi:hypothetical protein